MSWLDTKDPEVIAAAIEKLAGSNNPASKEIVDYAGGDLRFALWLYLVKKRCVTVLGLGIFDLEDWRWRDAYDAGSSPKEAFADFREDLGLDPDAE
jgi:hypothetical protein